MILVEDLNENIFVDWNKSISVKDIYMKINKIMQKKNYLIPLLFKAKIFLLLVKK